MTKRITGTGRVIVSPFTVQWPDGRCLLAYATDDNMAVVATVPVPDREHGDPSLWDVAARHLPTNVLDQNEAYGRWIMNHGWGMAVMPPKKNGLILDGDAWSVDVYKTAVLKAPCYGSHGVHIGRLKFDDDALMAQARALLP
jgi:hypothetical protein